MTLRVIRLAAILLVACTFAGQAFAQNTKGASAKKKDSAPKAPGTKLSPDKEALLKSMPRVGSRARSYMRQNLVMQQMREDMAREAAERKAEADRKEALRKAELRRAAADANRALKEREQERGERARKQSGESSKPVEKPAAKK